ncbi:centrosomal protein [Oopsacas minuta]|uniref:Centrosomal protein n=1 Tax=Oopsacas minuta TaxID=111878 RepID=A0AAV7JXU7_9METZ|nr:centrosomal protein [Oopsacas minuta]
MSNREIWLESSMHSNYSEASVGIIDLDNFDPSNSQFLTQPPRSLQGSYSSEIDPNITLEEDTSHGALTASPNSTLMAPSQPINQPSSYPKLNPFEDNNNMDQPVPQSFDGHLSPMFPNQEVNSSFPNQEIDPFTFQKQEFDASLFSNAEFHAPGVSFMEQLEGDEDDLKRKNSVIPEQEIVEISPPSSNVLDKPGDFTTYFGVRSNELGNLTQQITPTSRPRFSATAIRSPHSSAQLFKNNTHSPEPVRLKNEHTHPDRHITPSTDYMTPDLSENNNEDHSDDLLNKSNDLLKKVTSLLESKKFNADEFIKTLESEAELHIPIATSKTEHNLPLQTIPSMSEYERLPEHYLTPLPQTPIHATDIYPTQQDKDITLPNAYIVPNNSHSIAPNHHDYLKPVLSGDSLDSCNMENIPNFSSILRQHSLSNSFDEARDNNDLTPFNDVTIQHDYAQSADDVNSIPFDSPSHKHYNNEVTLQHSLLTNSADDVREVQYRRRNLSSTSASYSMPEGLDALASLPPLPSPPPATYIHHTSRRASREELTPKELSVDIELEDGTALNCCTGGINHAFLNLTNQSPCWVQTQLEFKSVKFGSNLIDTQSESMPFSMYNRCILGTAKSEQVKISFAPGSPGIYTIELDVYISKIVDSSLAKPSKTFSFTAEAIKPEISLLYKQESSKVLDFGFVTEGKSYEQCVTVVNKSNCSLPIKISLPTKKLTCRDLSLSLTSHSGKNPDIQKESHISTVLEARGEGVRGKMDLWVRFKPSYHPQIGVGSKSPAPLGEMNSIVEIFLDGPFASSTSKLINSIPITANFADSDLVILESIDTLRFETSVTRSLTRSFTLHNRGSIPISLTTELEPSSTDFMISPYHISLQPGQQSPASLSYRPSKHESTYTGTLHIIYNPGNKRYTLKVSAREEAPESPPDTQDYNLPPSPPQTSKPSPSRDNYLLSNILSLNWGATQLDECIERKIVLFNTSDDNLNLSVELNSQFFFVKDTDDKFKSSFRMSIPARVKLPTVLTFAPTELVVYNDNLSITDLSHNKVFQIPLTGYGGKSQILIVNAERTTEGYWMNIGEVKKLEKNIFKVYLLNNGIRKAYIKAVCRDNQPNKPILSHTQVSITPSEFIISPQDYKSILITFSPGADHALLCENSPHCIAYVSLTTCDCMTAKIYFSQLRAKNLQIPPPFDYLHKLFTLDISEDEDYSQFQLSTHPPSPPAETEVSIPLIGYPPSAPSLPRPRPSSVPVTRPLSHDDIIWSNRSSPIGTAPILHQSPDLIPPLTNKNRRRLSRHSTNDSPSPKPSHRAIHSPSRSGPKPAFTLYPSQLSLCSDSREPAKLYIHNLSHSIAKFAVVYPKQFVTVSPARGSIDPGREKQLLVSSLLMDMTDLPCSLTEYLTIHYEDSVKSVPLNILMESPSPTTPVRESFASVTKYLSPPNILFSPIKNNSVADLPITISNPHNFPIHWSLASMGQAAYQEGEEGSLEILKTSYAVFFFHRLSGGIASHGTSSISVTFQPRNPGTYTQTWEMQLTKSVKMIDSIKLSVSGKAEDTEVTKQPPNNSHKETHKSHSRRVYLDPDILNYPQTRPNTSSTLKVSVYNKSDTSIQFNVNEISIPFSIHRQHTVFTLDPRHCARLPIIFNPQSQGYFEEVLALKSSNGKKLHALLKAESCFYPKL